LIEECILGIGGGWHIFNTFICSSIGLSLFVIRIVLKEDNLYKKGFIKGRGGGVVTDVLIRGLCPIAFSLYKEMSRTMIY